MSNKITRKWSAERIGNFLMIARLTALAQHKGFRRYFVNTSWLLAEKILRLVVGLLVGIWVARYLGPDKYGLFSYTQSFVGIFAIIAKLGLDDILVRELVKEKSKNDILLGTAFFLKLLGALAVIGLLGIAVLFTSNDAFTNALIFIVASGTIFQSFNVIDIYFRSKVLSKFAVFANAISLGVSSLLKIYCILVGAPLIAFAVIVLLDSVVLAAGFIIFYRRNNLYLRSWTFSRATAKLLLKASMPLTFSSMLIMIYMKIDQVMIKEMLGNEAVGQYAAAVRISEAWCFVPTVICSSLYPAILNAKKQCETLYYSRLQKLFDLTVWLAIAVAIPTTLLSEKIVSFLFGSAYNETSNVLIIHIWAGVFSGLRGASGLWYMSENLQNLAFWRTFWGAIINFSLNIVFVPVIGIRGAAITTLLSYSAASVFFDFFNRKTRHVFFMKVNTINLKRLRNILFTKL